MRQKIEVLIIMLVAMWLGVTFVAGLGLAEKEDSFSDVNTVKLLTFALANRNMIDVVQQHPGDPLRLVVATYKEVSNRFGDDLGRHKNFVFNEKQWNRVERVMGQFAAAANWGIGDPFEYEVDRNGVRHVKAFSEGSLEYKNPFA